MPGEDETPLEAKIEILKSRFPRWFGHPELPVGYFWDRNVTDEEYAEIISGGNPGDYQLGTKAWDMFGQPLPPEEGFKPLFQTVESLLRQHPNILRNTEGVKELPFKFNPDKPK
ncbi:MAG: hypothetical protein HY397_00645 [Candidatus Doudnabacteria bacterium]|nr:hypothetical protein [Candidatus Doudnabacteria bacterium]